MLKLKSLWVVIPGTLVLISGMTGCRSAGQNHSAASSMIGQPSSQYAEGMRRGSGSDRGTGGNSYDSNGYLQPVPAPPVDDESASLSPSNRRGEGAGRPRTLRVVDSRTVKVGHETVSDAPSAEPVETQRKLVPETNANGGILKKMGDGFSDFMASFSGAGPRAKTSQNGPKRTRIQEKRLAARADDVQYVPFNAAQEQSPQTDSSDFDEVDASAATVPVSQKRTIDRNPVELGLPEAF